MSRVEFEGWTVAKAAEAQGVSRQTAHKWVTRYRAEGWPGLEDRAPSAVRALLDAAVWFASRGVRIERVLTDNAWAYTSPTCERAITSLDARHKRTQPHRPQTNGKAVRFIKTLKTRLAEWAYGHLYRTNEERLAALPAWIDYYNAERTHTALGGTTPMAALVNKLRGHHS